VPQVEAPVVSTTTMADPALSVDWRNRWTTALRHAEEFKRFEKDFRNC